MIQQYVASSVLHPILTGDRKRRKEKITYNRPCLTGLTSCEPAKGRGCRKSLRNREKWKNLWQRKHSQPVSRSLASPARPLVLRPMRCVHRIIALHIFRTAQGTHTFLTTVGHPAHLLTSQTWRILPARFRSPITYPLIFSSPCPRKGEGAEAYKACSPLRSGPRNALELPVCAPYDNFTPQVS